MNKEKEIVLQFSGGTDSTLAAALISEHYERVHLLTYSRFGFSNIENSRLNVEKLQSKYGENKFSHTIIPIDKITRFVFYERYFRNILKHGFFLINMCGLCKLAMHLRTIIYCLDNNIANACDGANKGMDIFPAQMDEGIQEIKSLYQHFGLNFSNPVFHFESPDEIGLEDRLMLDRILPNPEEKKEFIVKDTSGYKLFELGLMPSENVKGTELDRKMQARCFQVILFNIFVRWLYLSNHTLEDYKKAIKHLYNDKILHILPLIEEYTKHKIDSKLHKLLDK